MDNHKEVLLGKDAAAILDNAAYQTAIKNLINELTDALIECPSRDHEGRQIFALTLKIARKFDGMFHGMIENGKFAAHKIELDRIRDESPIQRMKRKVMA